MAFLSPASPSSSMSEPASSPNPSPTTPLTRLRSAFGTRRARKQSSLFFLGATFVFFSSIVTRRALQRRYAAAFPRTFTPSTEPPKFSGAGEAFEALTIATLNVTSAAFMLIGGSLWAFDISTVADLRRRIRGGLGVDGTGRGEKDVEEEFEEWIASTLARKEQKEEARRREGTDTVRTNERGRER